MEKRSNYKKNLANQIRNKRLAKVTTVCATGIILGAFAVPVLASEWVANTPESIQISQGSQSYTMKSGDTLWAIAIKTNINVNTLASINNINLSNGDQFTLQIGTVIHFDESKIKAVDSTGSAINKGVKVNDSNKIVKDKPIGANVSKEISAGKVTPSEIIGKPNNTGKLPNPNNDTSESKPTKPIEPVKPDEKPVNSDKFVTINVDEKGNLLESTTGYKFFSESTAKKVVKDDKGNTVTTYTTTKVWVKDAEKPTTPTNKDVFVTVNVDVNGTVLTSTEGYSFISESTDKKVETLENGNTVTTHTTTKIWKLDEKPTEPTNEDKYVTINIDVNGTVLTSTKGYSFISESTDKKVETLENGNTITTHTTTKIWKLDEKPTEPTNEDKYVTINVDVNGTILDNVDGYSFVSESTTSSVQTLPNGNTITTYTTTKTWKKNAPVEVVPVNPNDVGNSGILASTLADAGAQGEAMHNDPNSEFYWAWFAINEGSDDKVWAYKTAPVKMTDGSTYYTIVFYVDYV
ncbi:LysM peptidoglycan-binding domain-containing protein [Vagococcus sp. PNs007]|uniref:LysM peptidoglycan-binding domain-containing protein n=1 Tax=Vagococcus proximus TaxID=2991417 RepID=A0ABT5X0Z9_9ENTE|nr:LysM peptidoglycan-binding domain-containing protein [Vagococcus proximus]MDF0479664.1 LysM peptidoglycan-binding domain-containing protein [Vagococcus proximus]